ncbi:nitrite reductase small subunit NirD [Thiomicrorhabdus sp.]|uniref:nitrite reductase small subunit NirD n=1 Tax=Thiomicrorhabdus sp. TaxID=2039724 RepID=UPI00356888ED
MKAFEKVCSLNELVANSGVAALVKGRQIALFYLDDQVYALDNYDPAGKAYVLSRGMIGNLGEALVVASPLYKDHFNLQTGQCLEKPELSVEVFDAKIEDGDVWVSVE